MPVHRLPISRAPLADIMPRIMQEWGGETYTLSDAASNSQVALVHDAPAPYVVKIPHGRAFIAAANLYEEVLVLSYLALEEGPLTTPRTLEYDDNPLFAVSTQVPGDVYGSEFFSDLSALRLTPHEQRRVGEKLGSFMVWCDSVLPLATFMAERQGFYGLNYAHRWSYDDFFETSVGGFWSRDFPVLSAWAEWHWDMYTRYYPNGADHVGDRVNHGALSIKNLSWQNGEPIGCFDWGDARPGHIEQELRIPRQMGSYALEGAISELDRHGVGVDKNRVVFWDTLRTIGILTSWIMVDRRDSEHYLAAVDRLTRAFPNEDWSELTAPTAPYVRHRDRF